MSEALLGSTGWLYAPVAVFFTVAWLLQRVNVRIHPVLFAAPVVGYWVIAVAHNAVAGALVSIVAAGVVGAVMLWAAPALGRFTLLAIPATVAATPALGGLAIVLTGLVSTAVIAAARRMMSERIDVLTPAVVLAVRDVQTLSPVTVEKKAGRRYLIAPWFAAAAALVGLLVRWGIAG